MAKQAGIEIIDLEKGNSCMVSRYPNSGTVRGIYLGSGRGYHVFEVSEDIPNRGMFKGFAILDERWMLFFGAGVSYQDHAMGPIEFVSQEDVKKENGDSELLKILNEVGVVL